MQGRNNTKGRMMKFNIPPLALTILCIAIMFLLSWLLPQFLLNIPRSISILFAIFATLFSIMGVSSFRREKTTVNPTTPEKASTLVIKGIYRFSRNPMYLGFLLFLIAWGVFLQHSLSLFLIPTAFVLYINKIQIPVEEKALYKKFGTEFILYKNTVRRWL